MENNKTREYASIDEVFGRKTEVLEAELNTQEYSSKAGKERNESQNLLHVFLEN